MDDPRRIGSWWRAAVGARAARLLAVALIAAGLLASAPARANNVTIDTGNLTGGNTTRQAMYQFYISYADCKSGTWSITLPVTFAAGVSGTPQLWGAETDNCTTDLSRPSTVPNPPNGQCINLPLNSATTGSYTLTAAQILKVLGIGPDCVDPTGTSSVRAVTLYFLLTGSTETTAGTIDATNSATYTISVELTGPNAPTGVTVGTGDGLLILNLPTNMDSNTQGYYVFCDPNPTPPDDAGDSSCNANTTTSSSSSSSTTTSSSSTTTSSSSSSSGAGGTGGASTTSSSTGGVGGTSAADAGAGSTDCADQTPLPCLDSKHPTADSRYVCQSLIPASATAPVLAGLTNGKAYTIGIAGYDNVGNLGALSVLQCGTPEPTETYFNQYCADGGNGCGGCGSCAVGANTNLTWPGLAALALAAVGLGVRRDDRRRRAARARNTAET